MAASHSFSSPPDDADLPAVKARMRQEALRRRAGLDGEASGRSVTDQILRLLPLPAGTPIAGVWPLPGELDLRPLWNALHDAGHAILLPQTTPRGTPLIFRLWTPGCPMTRERFGTLCPDGPEDDPALIFVPLLAFDGEGRRLGYGGGYYDRTLAARPGIPAVGLGFAALRVPAVPADRHDRPLDAIFTEEGLAVDRRAAS